MRIDTCKKHQETLVSGEALQEHVDGAYMYPTMSFALLLSKTGNQPVYIHVITYNVQSASPSSDYLAMSSSQAVNGQRRARDKKSNAAPKNKKTIFGCKRLVMHRELNARSVEHSSWSRPRVR